MKKLVLKGPFEGKTIVLGGVQFVDGSARFDSQHEEAFKNIFVRFYGCEIEDAGDSPAEDAPEVDPNYSDPVAEIIGEEDAGDSPAEDAPEADEAKKRKK